MESAIHILRTVERDGEVAVSGLPYRRGQKVERILRRYPARSVTHPRLTARQLLKSRLVGLWADRTDIRSSITFARKLRRTASRRTRT